jgi:phosphoribosylaminoimidazolecarboxamide formyltransferase/IMP cyclohydrolase
VHRAYEARAELRYGENPHQRGGLYGLYGARVGPLGGAEVLQGKEMSFNNWLDADAARGLVGMFEPDPDLDGPAVVIVKHNNPCGVAVAGTLAEAYRRAHACDPVSAFGGIVAFNAEVDEGAALATKGVFTEVVIAPAYTDGALAAFAQRENLRVVRAPLAGRAGLEVRQIDGGALVQDVDALTEMRADMRVAGSRRPSEAEWRDLLFAWRVAAKVKSNAIVLAKDLATVGIGAGQMNRVISVDIAARQAGEHARGSSLASDAFFPFRDSLDRAAEAGVTAVISPGGSVRDDEVLATAEDHAMAMVFTGRRHFRH